MRYSMKRYLYVILMWLCSLSAIAQTEGYNPTNPPLPDFPTEDQKDTTFKLAVYSSPLGCGTLSTSGGQYKEGASVNLRAYNSGNFYFMYWIDDEGNTLSTSSSFNYIMPKRDAVVTAVYKYAPANPELPDFPEGTNVPTYKLQLDTKPAGAGSFNISSKTLKENESIHLYAYANNNFYFKRWEDAQGNTISTAQNFYYTMPAVDTQLYAIYTYNPSNPSNPGKNYYDSFTGEVIIDDFTKGNLSSAIYDVTKGNTSNITSITVAGVINSNDFSIANNYSSCSIVDLSRTNGVNTVPSYCYDGNTHLNRLSLPACITNIEYRAFRNATALTELTCHATVPPTLGSNVFSGVNKGLVVYVPASSIQLYEQAAGWKEYEADGTIVIMPIQSQVSALEVNLPTECADGRYKNMPLELLNVKSGQKFKYVVTDRINYTFNNLVNGTRYVATLKNLSGQVLAKTDTISITDENVSVTFDIASMKQLRSVKASVLTTDGTDVTSNCVITWYDANGTFLSQSKSLEGQVSETKVRCAVSLSQALAMEYVLPADSLYEVVEGENNVIFTLAPLPKIQLSGRILDVTTQQAISNANVTVSQTLNGKYSKSLSGKTDNRGAYTMTVFVAPSSVTFAANDYVSQTIELADSVFTKEESTLADVKLKPITGATITTNFTYATSVAAGVEPDVQNYYSDYNNVAYYIYNVTEQKEIRQFNVQYPNIVLLEEVNQGDSLQIIAKSKTGAFMDVATGGRVDDALRLDVTVPVVQLGGIDATFTTTENSKVLGILYDSKGAFVNKYNYGSATLSIRELKDGEYTLVTMGASDFFGSIYNLEKFSEAGLQQNIDYLVNKVTVKSGIISPLKNVLVPFFDESKFYYTGDNTSFTVNKTSIVAGNYLTLTAKVDFKEVYKNSISDVKVSIELPEGTTMVDNSVMVGSDVAFYELNGNTLTIPLDNNVSSDRVRFCVIPTQSGSFAPNASVAFKLGDKSVSQPMGSTSYTVKDIAISVPSEINTPEITITGVASGKADVTVYANGDVLGTTTALANGWWSLTTELDEPYNLQEFDIYADVASSTGLSVKTETQKCLYNKDVIVAKTVDMSFYNGWMKKNITVTFDLEHQTSDASSYSFYTETDFTFAANLSNNDTTIVKSVTIGVYTNHEGWIDLEATYNAKMDRWVAVHKFGSSNLPTGVKVDFDAVYEYYADQAQIDAAVNAIDEAQQKSDELRSELDMLDAENKEISANIQKDTALIDVILNALDIASREEIAALTSEYYAAMGEDIDVSDFEFNTIEDLLTNGEKLLAEKNETVSFEDAIAAANSLLSEENDIIDSSQIFATKSDTITFKDVNGDSYFIQKTHISKIEIKNLQDVETAVIKTTTGDSLRITWLENGYLIFDQKTDSVWVIAKIENYEDEKILLSRKKITVNDIIESLQHTIDNVPEIFNRVRNAIDCIAQPIKNVIAEIDNGLNEVEDQLTRLRQQSAAKLVRQRQIEKQIASLEKYVVDYPSSNKVTELWNQKIRLENERKTIWEEIKKLHNDRGQLEGARNALKSRRLVQVAALNEILGYIDIARGILKVGDYASHGLNDYLSWQSFVNSITPCDGDKENAMNLERYSKTQMDLVGGSYVRATLLAALSPTINGLMQFNPAAKTASWVFRMLMGAITSFVDEMATRMYNEARNISEVSMTYCREQKGKLKCEDDKCPKCHKKPCECEKPCPVCNHKPCICCKYCHLYPCKCEKCSKCGKRIQDCTCKKCKKCGRKDCTCKPEPTVDPIHDPSGFVYEGVFSNRLQGVTATCYYKELVEDMYGDLHENIVLWDAEEYAQRNPLFTDENGMYQWDVPQGLWQVRFEKEGYVPTQSEWLPVPPPQMDVNIGMVQNAQPEVVSARAYEDGVEVEFSKYMNLESLTTDNIYVKVCKGQDETLIEDATIEYLNEEVAIEGSTTSYASKVKVATDKLGYYDEAYIIVSTGVNSYAGIPMAEVYQQKLDVEKKVQEIAVEDAYNVEYEGEREIVIAALPVEASVGKTIRIASASDMIAKTDVTSVTLDADGQATFKVSGELLGSTALNFSLDDADLKATVLINVVDAKKLEAVKEPFASRISGTSVFRGQTVTLTCESEGATIYYTVDGSCPCDETKRIKYERPISINEAMTLKVMAVGANFDESDVKEYTYGIRQSDIKLNLTEGWNWSSHDVASPISVDELSGVASRVLTKTGEVIDDPVLGLVGNLTTIDGAETMKVKATKTTLLSFVGEQYNPSLTPIVLNKGWNWLGYPINQTMTINDALTYLDVEEGDVITNLDGGFATYSDDAWVGTLQTLIPGSGYLYKAASSKSFIYNTTPTVSAAKALYGHRLELKSAPWTVDKHRYPNLMPVIAQIRYCDEVVSDSTWFVGAFAGDECRGVGTYEDNMLMLSVYGDPSANITFRAVNVESGRTYDFVETLPFGADIVGSVNEPFVLRIGDSSGITSAMSENSVNGIFNLQGMRVRDAHSPGLYIINTTDANGKFVIRKKYVK